MFIRQCAAAGYISRDIKPATFGNTQLSYASLNVTERGREYVNDSKQVLLPILDAQATEECKPSSSRHSTSGRNEKTHRRTGKGKHMLPI